MHPPWLPPPSPHEAMEADQEPLDRERGHVHAPRLARSTKRKEMVEEIRCSFIAQGRNFKTTTSCSKQVAYKCDGCAFTFKLSVCQKQDSQEFGTWGLTKKALEQSRSTGLFGQASRLTLSPGVHILVGQIRPPNMFWTPPGPPEDDPARHKSISRL